ncbi:MAG: type II toxin-antitoxin system VapC family toxin [Rhizobiaceae bacterium]
MAAFVVDTSALISVLANEADAQQIKVALSSADSVHISVGTVFETSCVVRGDRFPEGTRRLDRLLQLLDLEYAAFDEEQMTIAREGYVRFGRGSGHRANLNMGDCFAYALAKTRALPLLFKGEDFTHTDIEPALKFGARTSP